MSKVPAFIHIPHNSSLAMDAVTLSADMNTVVILPWSDNCVHWWGWICHASKQVLQPILCHCNMPSVVTIFLKEISGAVLITQKFDQWSTSRKPFHFYASEKKHLLCLSVHRGRQTDMRYKTTIIRSDNIFQLAEISLCMTPCRDVHLKVTK